MKRVCIYLRLTKDDLYDAMRVVQRQKKIIELIENEQDWTYAGAYVCTDNIDKEFHRLLDDCRAGRIDVIVIKNMWQLGRNRDECLQSALLVQEAAAGETELISIDEGILSLEELLIQIRSMPSDEEEEKKVEHE